MKRGERKYKKMKMKMKKMMMMMMMDLNLNVNLKQSHLLFYLHFRSLYALSLLLTEAENEEMGEV